MKVEIWADEAWPTFEIEVLTHNTGDYEITDALYRRYVSAAREWREVQAILRQIKDPKRDL